MPEASRQSLTSAWNRPPSALDQAWRRRPFRGYHGHGYCCHSASIGLSLGVLLALIDHPPIVDSFSPLRVIDSIPSTFPQNILSIIIAFPRLQFFHPHTQLRSQLLISRRVTTCLPTPLPPRQIPAPTPGSPHSLVVTHRVVPWGSPVWSTHDSSTTPRNRPRAGIDCLAAAGIGGEEEEKGKN